MTTPNTGRKPSFRVRSFEFHFFENDPTQNKTLERELEHEVGSAEIVHVEHRRDGKILIITREWGN